MKSIFKILCLGAVLMLATTAVVDQGLAADKGSQLIFQTDMSNTNYISVSNTSADAVTVLTQYYNDEMALVLWYLRVIPGGGNVLVNPFNHEIPGTAEKDDDGMRIPGTGTNVSIVIDDLPAMTNDDDGPGVNSGRFVITVSAVGANTVADAGKNGANTSDTVNILFPTFLAADLHGTDNIDNCGMLKTSHVSGGNEDNLTYTENGTDGVNDCRKADPDAASDSDSLGDSTSKNVGDLSVATAEPIAFNHLTGSFTEALISTGAGGADQTASWGGTPVIRTGVGTNMMMAPDYQTLNGMGDTPSSTGHLAEMSAGGTEVMAIDITVEGYLKPSKITNTDRQNRGLKDGSLVLPALYGGSSEETHQVMYLLSVADDYGDRAKGKGGDYALIPAKTGYKVSLKDGMGDELPDPAADSNPVFGGVESPDAPPGVSIIVEGIQVMTDANLGKCTGTMINGAWTLSALTSIVPTASSGAKDFDGLDAMLDSAMSASPGSITFMRTSLTCKKDYGDGDAATGSSIEDDDGVPTTDERTYTAGTLIMEEPDTDRTFVTTGQAVLKFITADSTFGASWSLK